MTARRENSTNDACSPKSVAARVHSSGSLKATAGRVDCLYALSEINFTSTSKSSTCDTSDEEAELMLAPLDEAASLPRQLFAKAVRPPSFPTTQQHAFRRRSNDKQTGLTSVAASLGNGAQPADHVASVILDQFPQSKIAFVCSHSPKTEAEFVIVSADKPLEFPSALQDASQVFILVENNEECVERTSQMLHLRPKAGGNIIVVLMGTLVATDHVSTLMTSGATDVLMLPVDSAQLPLSIAVSLAKAAVIRKRETHLESKLHAARKQCENLFWNVSHEIVQGFPEVKPGIKEVAGKCVGHIHLGKKVGEGAFGTVHSWQDPAKGRSGAVKVIAKDTIRNVDKVVQVANEYFLMQRLKHKNVASSTDFVHGRYNLYLFMEMAGSSNLFKMIGVDQGGLPHRQVEDLYLQVARGVAHCHDMKIAHCDIKPENIVVGNNGCAKLVDFGEGVDVAQEVFPLEAPKGTMPFMAPEIISLSPSWKPPAADVWALGVVLLEMLCGVGAFAKMVGWPSKSLVCEKRRAEELLVFFAKGDTEDTPSCAMVALRDNLKHEPSPSLVRLLVGMFELPPERRTSSQDIIQHIVGGFLPC